MLQCQFKRPGFFSSLLGDTSEQATSNRNCCAADDDCGIGTRILEPRHKHQRWRWWQLGELQFLPANPSTAGKASKASKTGEGTKGKAMKTKLAIAAALLVVGLSSALASPIYDRSGNLMGYSVANKDGSATAYDRNGNFVVHTKNLRSYDRYGHLVGFGRRHGSTLTHYDSSGRIVGRSTHGTGCSRGRCWRFSNGAYRYY